MNPRPPAKGFDADQATVETKGGATCKIGVLLVNLGTPDGTDYWSVRRYLKEFLSDRRVIETNRALWWVILNVVVLTVRPSLSGAKYRSVWNEALDECPCAPSLVRKARRSRQRSPRAPMSWSTGRCATAIRASPRASRRYGQRGAIACSSSRSIRNIPPRPRRA